MLISLSIRDFVLISRLDLSPEAGFTVITGDTGAGKSTLLDALELLLGAAADRRLVRSGAAQASITAGFAIAEGHPVWSLLRSAGIAANPEQMLTLKRLLPVSGPARAFIQEEPVSATLLTSVAEQLIEIHGQHAAARLFRPSSHRITLDAYGDCGPLLARLAAAHQAMRRAGEHHGKIFQARQVREAEAAARREAIAELTALAPQDDEASQLAAERADLLQIERIKDNVAEAAQAIGDSAAEAALCRAARAVERLTKLPGASSGGSPLTVRVKAAAEALERTMIEYHEAQAAIEDLQELAGGKQGLESVENRLYALRSAGRKYGVDPDHLTRYLESLLLEEAAAGHEAAELEQAERALDEATRQFRAMAERLSTRRKAAARRLETALARELKPLRLGGLRFRVAFTPLEFEAWNAQGAEEAEFEIAANPGADFAPLRKVASGGELVRLSLALKCVLSAASAAPTLVFDEADQGVSGAVAAAIGDRFAGLAATRQVFAVTHSPQVASQGQGHWLVEKPAGTGETRLRLLDRRERQEEIARMLSGAEVSNEARAAARRLLEVG